MKDTSNRVSDVTSASGPSPSEQVPPSSTWITETLHIETNDSIQ
jgi:hypothetical protein